MAVKMHVTKIEAADEGGVLVSVIIESDLGPIELEIHADLKTDARITDPIVNAVDEVREKLQKFAYELRNEAATPGLLDNMLRLSRPSYEQSDEIDDE
jgi:hypothetical protein